jgi:hypothetical protein
VFNDVVKDGENEENLDKLNEIKPKIFHPPGLRTFASLPSV